MASLTGASVLDRPAGCGCRTRGTDAVRSGAALGEGRRSWAATVAAGPAAARPAKSASEGVPAAPREREALLAWLAASTQALLDALREASAGGVAAAGLLPRVAGCGGAGFRWGGPDRPTAPAHTRLLTMRAYQSQAGMAPRNRLNPDKRSAPPPVHKIPCR